MDGFHELVHHSTSKTYYHWPVSSTTIWDIPHEILTQIFSLLSVSERGNVRRTCSAWYDACNALRILETEKLRICVEVDCSSLVFETLLACQLKCLNLEFEKLKFCQSSISFWEHCGERILSISFCECSFENGLIIEKVLMHCPNLLLFEINNCDERSNNAMALGLMRCSIVRENLISLKLKNCHFLNDFIYTMMVRIFPNVRELLFEHVNLNCYKRVDKRFYVTGVGPYISEDIFSFTCVFNHLKSVASQIKKLSLHSIGDKGLTSDWLNDITMITDLRLNHLSLEGHALLTEQSLVNLLSKQTNLTGLVVHRCIRMSYESLLKIATADRSIEFS